MVKAETAEEVAESIKPERGGSKGVVGTKAQVFHGTAMRTAGRLKQGDLMKNKHGRIVSKRKHEAGKHSLKFLEAKGYKTKKGTFGHVKGGEQPHAF